MDYNRFGRGASTDTIIEFCQNNNIRCYRLDNHNIQLSRSELGRQLRLSGFTLNDIWNQGESPQERREQALREQTLREQERREQERREQERREQERREQTLREQERREQERREQTLREQELAESESDDDYADTDLQLNLPDNWMPGGNLDFGKHYKKKNPRKSPGRPRKSPGRPRKSPGRPRKSPGRPRKSPGRPRKSPGRPRKSPGRPRKSPGRPRKSPEGSRKGVNYSKKYVKSPTLKTVKNKKNNIMGKRLSARAIYNEYGPKMIGKDFNILQPNGEYIKKYLRLKSNGSPYWSTKFGNVHSQFDINNKSPYFKTKFGNYSRYPIPNLNSASITGFNYACSNPTLSKFGKTCFG